MPAVCANWMGFLANCAAGWNGATLQPLVYGL